MRAALREVSRDFDAFAAEDPSATPAQLRAKICALSPANTRFAAAFPTLFAQATSSADPVSELDVAHARALRQLARQHCTALDAGLERSQSLFASGVTAACAGFVLTRLALRWCGAL